MNHDGTFDPLLDKGGLVMQRDRIGPPDITDDLAPFLAADELGNIVVNHEPVTIADFFAPGGPLSGLEYERVPDEANTISPRIATLVFGTGLVEAVPDQVFLDLANSREKTAFGIKGRPNLGDAVPLRGFGYDKREPGGNKVGRFGRKAQAPTVAAFNAGALLNEVGLASKDQPLQNTRNGPAIDFEPEISQEDVGRLNAFSRFLAPPFPDGGNPRGEKIFTGIGCALCHVPTLKTGKNTIGIPGGIEFHPYSDFLLHKMGPTLADRIVEAGAAGDEWRTAPLWGLRLRTRYLHDGRARTLDEAITMHASRGRDGIADSEANYVIARYVLLDKQDKAALLDWLSHQ